MQKRRRLFRTGGCGAAAREYCPLPAAAKPSGGERADPNQQLADPGAYINALQYVHASCLDFELRLSRACLGKSSRFAR